MYMAMNQSKIDGLVAAWQVHCNTIGDWQALTKGVEPIAGGCGLVYELANPLHRPGEDFAIADMRSLPFAEPHYHPTDSWEFYFILQGSGTVYVGQQEQHVGKGDAVIIPPNTGHFTIPQDQLVLAVVSSPPFDPKNYIVLQESRPDIDFDYQKFKSLASI